MLKRDVKFELTNSQISSCVETVIRRLTKHVYVQSIIFLSSGVQPFNVQITAVFEYLMPPLFFALTNLPPKTVSLISVPFVDGSSC